MRVVFMYNLSQGQHYRKDSTTGKTALQEGQHYRKQYTACLPCTCREASPQLLAVNTFLFYFSRGKLTYSKGKGPPLLHTFKPKAHLS
jgi:hypothetical protein